MHYAALLKLREIRKERRLEKNWNLIIHRIREASL